jgi:hypothetical protein
MVASVDIGKSWKLGEATQADVSYAQMALAFEYYMENSKNLYDPFTADLDQSLWLRYIGDSFLAANDVEISEESTGMGSYHLSYLACVLEIINVWHCLCLWHNHIHCSRKHFKCIFKLVRKVFRFKFFYYCSIIVLVYVFEERHYFQVSES